MLETEGLMHRSELEDNHGLQHARVRIQHRARGVCHFRVAFDKVTHIEHRLRYLSRRSNCTPRDMCKPDEIADPAEVEVIATACGAHIVSAGDIIFWHGTRTCRLADADQIIWGATPEKNNLSSTRLCCNINYSLQFDPDFYVKS